ncbi:MAG: thymidine phosphorylase [Pseudomonadales bacterium]|nr:thymidine phosphorylase [Pseudomonadales bacterium]
MLIQDLICKKRDGLLLEDEEIEAFVSGITDGSLSEGQIAAFAMATFFTDMEPQECISLTKAMKNSGDTLQWQSLDLPGPVADKHSSGGVGDKASLMLGPMLASCGVFVPMISGRGLGHTGGTLDKLDSIPGYNTLPNNAKFQDVVKSVGCAIVGQTANLAPADKRFYAIRDVTGTVESLPLITASILSKKLSAGLDCLVMDVKTGNGAFANTMERATDLAQRIVSVAGGMGLPTTVLITDMSEVLGPNAGNALEIMETINYLKGTFRDPRLHEVVISLGAELLLLAGTVSTNKEGRDQLNQSLDSGAATERFSKMVSELGGPNDLLEATTKYLPAAQIICPIFPHESGIISEIDVRSVGNTIIELGGGRRVATDTIDFSVGLSEIRGLGDKVDPQTPIAMVHARNQTEADIAIKRVQTAFSLTDSLLTEQAPKQKSVIIEKITAP